MANPTILPLTTEIRQRHATRAGAGGHSGSCDAASFNFKAVLQRMVQQNASDVHLKVGRPPMLRVNGDLVPLELPPLKPGRSEGARRADHDAASR